MPVMAEHPEHDPTSTGEARTQRANRTIGRVLRYVGLIAGIVIGWNLGLTMRPAEPDADHVVFPLLVASALGALLFIAMPYLTLGLYSWLRQEIRKVEATDLIAAAVGLLVGGLFSALLALPIAMLPDPVGQFLPLAVALAVCAVTMIATVTKKRELLSMIGRGSKSSEAETLGNPSPGAPELLIDTSAIIDGRIAELARSGFLSGRLVVPQFVLHELQMVADSSDPSKRSRGARGLDVLEQLRSAESVDLEIRECDVAGVADVDNKLVALAVREGATIFTGDTNLEKVAALQGARVLNVHHLAKIMRPTLSLGDTFFLDVVQPGREYDQGVGFLTDGTMVVVEAGEKYVGRSVPVVVTRMLQTSGGRMIFARLKSDGENS
jgi:uncharacterized protein YacL